MISRVKWTSLALGLASGVWPALVGAESGDSTVPSKETPYVRDAFYVGGKYEFNQELKGSLFVDDVYVEKLAPVGGKTQPYPLVFFHGGGPSGATWLNTPDNRQGWASYFVDLGYEVYLLDQSGIGRASSNDLAGYPQRFGATAELAAMVFTAPERYNLYPQAAKHTQWPGNGTKGDPAFDAFLKTLLPIGGNLTRVEGAIQTAGCDLLERIGPSYLVGHSSGAPYLPIISDLCPDRVAGAVNLEPFNTPFFTFYPAPGRPAWPYGLSNIPLTYDPPIDSADELETETVGEDSPERRQCVQQKAPAKQLVNVSKVPALVVVGEASIHATWDHCVVRYMRQVGISTDFLVLAKEGILGNGHFFYLEKNNLEIAAIVERWIRKPKPQRDSLEEPKPKQE
ncbi:MAG: hypothetical protein M1837_002499 [Sclerophora amabilis]|nr:MAG: hypothetical protein M1837_002499 [Sclerophora amabilis]